MFENAVKGWVMSIIGLAGIVITFLHWSGIYVLPNPKALDSNAEAATALVISFALFGLPKTKIDLWIEQLIQAIVDQFKAVVDRFKGGKKDA